jgi:iron complex outermembrane receptor protein
VIVLCALAFGQEPAAADDARARELYQNGAVLYEEGRYEDAIAAWEEAYRLSGRAALLYNMANAYERAGRWKEAMDSLQRYRAYASADERETLDRRIRNIDRRLEEQRSASSSSTTTQPTTQARRGEGSPWLGPVPIALGATGVVAFGVGTVLGLRAEAARSEAAGVCVGTVCPDSAATSLASDRGNALGADISFGVGVAAIGIGITYVLLTQDAQLSVGPGTVLLHGTFR